MIKLNTFLLALLLAIPGLAHAIEPEVLRLSVSLDVTKCLTSVADTVCRVIQAPRRALEIPLEQCPNASSCWGSWDVQTEIEGQSFRSAITVLSMNQALSKTYLVWAALGATKGTAEPARIQISLQKGPVLTDTVRFGAAPIVYSENSNVVSYSPLLSIGPLEK